MLGWPAKAIRARRRALQRVADEELVGMLAASDVEAFELLYDRHGAAAYSLAYRIVGDRTLAEDVTQEAFLAVWRGSAGYSPERGSVRNWLLGIVHHRSIDAIRRSLVHERRRAGERVLEREPDRALTDVEAVRRDEARSVRAALEALPRDQLRVIELAYFGGFTHAQIAELLDMPLGTVKGRMRLGLERMRRELAGEAA
jgi:RNA polymerase sigma-70 factor (ECF subfamily)